MKNKLKNELKLLKNKTHVDIKIFQQFRKRVDHPKGLLKHENQSDHFCVFFLPIHTPSQSIYLGHHIKADDWIPPGGHIEQDEHPLDTVRREFEEELQFTIDEERIEFFDLTIKQIDNPIHKCKVHWDMWYLVHLEQKIDFVYLEKEFHDAGWFPLTKAINKIKKNPNYKKTVSKLFNYYY